MTETASSVLTDALMEINVRASESPIEADEAQSAIRYMNRFMDRLALEGCNLGYTEVADLADEITIPSGAIDGLIANLALSLAPQFGRPATPELALRAREGKKAMFIAGVTITPSKYPSILPIGIANEAENSNYSHFYPDEESTILSESNGTILLEDDTE